MTPTFRLSPEQKHNGFTLIELLTVIAIMSLLALLLIPRRPSEKQLSTTKNQIILLNELHMLHKQAVLGGKRSVFPVKDSGLIFEPAVGGNKETLIFWPDGSSNGGTLRHPDQNSMVLVEWRTGHIYAK